MKNRILSLLSAVLFCVASKAIAETYHVTDIGSLAGSTNFSYAHGVNANGAVCGYWVSNNQTRAFIYANQTLTDLGTLGGTNHWALSINADSAITGFAELEDGTVRTFWYRDGLITNLNWGGLQNFGFSINDSNWITGYVQSEVGANAALYSPLGVLIQLGTLGGTNSYGFGVNNAGKVAGSSRIADNLATHAFIWQNGTITDLNSLLPPGNLWTLLEARAISEQGAVVGWGITNGLEEAFLFESNSVTALGMLPFGTNSAAFGVNGSNWVVGFSMTNGVSQPFLWRDGVMTNVNEMLDTDDFDVREIRGINDWGEMVGFAVISNREHAVLLTPTTLDKDQDTIPDIDDSFPLDYYNGTLPQLNIVSGNNQSGLRSDFVALPLIVRVTDTNGVPLTNAPVTFSGSSGAGQFIQTGGGGALASTLTVRTGNDGRASVDFLLGASAPQTNSISATAISGTNTTNVVFTANVVKVATPTLLPGTGSYAAQQSVTVSSSTTGVTIHYTLNGQEPTESDPTVSNGGTVTVQWNLTLKAKAWKTGAFTSESQSANYSITGGIAAGYNHTLALRADGKVLSWGLNANGQLGDGTLVTRASPVMATNLTNIIQVKAGDLHSLALKSDGTVWAFGNNANGRLGDGTGTQRTNPVKVASLTNATWIAAGGSHSLAVSNGNVWAWGLGTSGRLGTGNASSSSNPVPVITVDGGVTNALANVVSVAAGDSHSLALKGDGTVWVFGNNANGRLGLGNLINQTNAVQATNLTNIVAIAAGGSHSLFLKSDGTVWACGLNSNGQLGDGSVTQHTSPVKVTNLTSVVGISAGFVHSMALKSDGTVYAWGLNSFGRLGDGTITQRTSPTQVLNASGVVAVAAGEEHSVILKSNGTVLSCGHEQFGQLGEGEFDYSTTYSAVTSLSGVIGIGLGGNHNFAIQSDGSLRSWGLNANAQLGDGTTSNRTTSVAVANLTNVVQVEAGDIHSLALKSDGTVWAFGNNGSGRLGDGTGTQRTNPVRVVGITNATWIAAGGAHSLAVSNGNVWAWGLGTYGRLGDGTPNSHSNPVQVVTVDGGVTNALANVVAVAAGDMHSIALDSSSNVWVWGNNGSGRLGIGSLINQTNPVLATNLSNIVAVAAGGSHSMFLKNDGTVWAAGLNSSGQLGDGTATQRTSPVRVTNLTDVAAIFAGDLHSLAVLSNGTVRAWGSGGSGRLGNGGTTNNTSPVTVLGLTNAVAVAAGDAHSIALKSDGTVWSWGYTVNGQLGNGEVGYEATLVGATETWVTFNNPPVVSVPGAQSTGEDTNLTINGISVSDSDAGSAAVLLTLSVTNGSLTLGNTNGLTIIAGTNGVTTNLSVTGTITLLNGATLSYLPGTNYNGSDSLTVRIDDQGHDGLGGAHADEKTVAITVTPVNDTPVATGESYSISEDALLSVPAPGLLSNETDVDGNSLQAILVTSPTNGSVTLNPDGSFYYQSTLHYVGSDNFTYKVNDGTVDGNTVAVAITMTAENDAPTIHFIPEVAVYEDSGPFVVSLTGITSGDPSEANTLTVTAASSDTNIIAAPAVTYTSPNATGSLTLTPLTNASGSVTITVTVQDNGGGADTILAAFTVFVVPVNDAPGFSLSTNLISVLEDAGFQTITNVAVGLSSGPTDEALQWLDFIVTPTGTNFFLIPPAIDWEGTLTFQTAPDANGTNVVTVFIQDEGGTEGGGVNTNTAQTFSIVATPVNDPPVFTLGTNWIQAPVNTGLQTYVGFLTNFTGGPTDETNQALTFSVFPTNSTNFAVQPTIDTNGTLTFQIQTNFEGTIELTAVVKDNNGTNYGGIDTNTAPFGLLAFISPGVPGGDEGGESMQGGGGGEDFEFSFFELWDEGFDSFSSSYLLGDTNGLWLEITGVTTNVVAMILHGTESGEYYYIYTKTSLTNVSWEIITNVVAAASTNRTTTSINVSNPPQLFFWASSAADSDSDGLADPYETTISSTDPGNPDTDGDGLSDGFEVIFGLNPNTAQSTPTLQGLTISTCPVTN